MGINPFKSPFGAENSQKMMLVAVGCMAFVLGFALSSLSFASPSNLVRIRAGGAGWQEQNNCQDAFRGQIYGQNAVHSRVDGQDAARYVCTSAEVKSQRKFLAGEVHKGCDRPKWLQALALILAFSGDRQAPVLIDICANKGYTAAEWLGVFVPSFGLNNIALGAFYEEMFPTVGGGMCNDKTDLQRPFFPAESAPRIFCLEPSFSTYGMLQRSLVQHFRYPKMEVLQRAVSNETGVASFADCGVGAENSGLGNPACKTAEVPVTTVDGFMKEKGLDIVTLLKMDTEGFDPLALMGARGALSSNSVRVLLFEYHAISMWAFHALESWVFELDSYGYDCYLNGNKALYRLTGCWHKDFEFHQWSNVVCSSRSFVHFNNVLMALSVHLEVAIG